MRSSLNWASLTLAITLCAACTAERRDYEHSLYAFGTYVGVSFYGVSDKQDHDALRRLETLFADVDRNWYPWAPGELQRINAAIAAGDCTVVSQPLRALIQLARYYETPSRGHFNASLGRLTELWGFHDPANPISRTPDDARLAELLQPALSLHTLRWEGAGVCGSNPAVMIDLGGIAKGAILEASREVLAESGIDNAIINIGGDLIVIGTIDHRLARIGIRSPLADVPIAGLDVRAGEAVFTSGTYERFVEIDGVRYAHVLHPVSGYPVAHAVSVTVVDKDPQFADAAATALLVGGREQFDRLVVAMNVEYAFLVDAQGDTRLTPAMEQRLKWTDPGNQQ